MPIGPITPGDPVTVSPDASLSPYASMQAPTATMVVVAADIQALTLALLNVQDLVRGELASALAAMAVLFVTADLRATTVFDVRSGQIHAGAGAIQIGGGSDVITVTGSNLDLGTTDVSLGGTSTVESGGTLAIGTGGSFSLHAGAVGLVSGAVGLDGTLNALAGSVVTLEAGSLAQFQGRVALDGVIDLVGTGYISQRQGVQSTDANTVIAALAYTTYKIPNAVLSTTRLLTINDGPSGMHPRIRIWSQDGASGMDLRNQGGGIIGGTVINKATLGGGEYRWVDIEWNGSSTWEIVGGERS
ncbi:MAG TPA: hypothetical protein VK550_12335 [Polyangiaceae bacterium]|nr:hypothetical protein [Polyangiaceae bacterium]